MPELVELVGPASTFFAEQNLTVLYRRKSNFVSGLNAWIVVVLSMRSIWKP